MQLPSFPTLAKVAAIALGLLAFTFLSLCLVRMVAPADSFKQKGYVSDGLMARSMHSEMRDVSFEAAEASPQGGALSDTRSRRFDVYIETTDMHSVCSRLRALEEKEGVLVERFTESGHNCSTTLFVPDALADSLLSSLEDMHPRDIHESIHEYLDTLESISSRKESLLKQLSSVQSTLAQAERDYTALQSSLRTSPEAAQALADLIALRATALQQLSRDEARLVQQIDSIRQNEARTKRQVTHTQFYISAEHIQYLDIQAIQDSWRASVQGMLMAFSITLQLVTTGFVSFMLYALVATGYAAVVVVGLLYAWRAIKKAYHRICG